MEFRVTRKATKEGRGGVCGLRCEPVGTARKAKGRDHYLGLYVRAEGGEGPGFSKEEPPTIQKEESLLVLLFDTFDEQFIQARGTRLSKVLSVAFATLIFNTFLSLPQCYQNLRT